MNMRYAASFLCSAPFNIVDVVHLLRQRIIDPDGDHCAWTGASGQFGQHSVITEVSG